MCSESTASRVEGGAWRSCLSVQERQGKLLTCEKFVLSVFTPSGMAALHAALCRCKSIVNEPNTLDGVVSYLQVHAAWQDDQLASLVCPYCLLKSWEVTHLRWMKRPSLGLASL